MALSDKEDDGPDETTRRELVWSAKPNAPSTRPSFVSQSQSSSCFRRNCKRVLTSSLSRARSSSLSVPSFVWSLPIGTYTSVLVHFPVDVKNRGDFVKILKCKEKCKRNKSLNLHKTILIVGRSLRPNCFGPKSSFTSRRSRPFVDCFVCLRLLSRGIRLVARRVSWHFRSTANCVCSPPPHWG